MLFHKEIGAYETFKSLKRQNDAFLHLVSPEKSLLFLRHVTKIEALGQFFWCFFFLPSLPWWGRDLDTPKAFSIYMDKEMKEAHVAHCNSNHLSNSPGPAPSE